MIFNAYEKYLESDKDSNDESEEISESCSSSDDDEYMDDINGENTLIQPHNDIIKLKQNIDNNFKSNVIENKNQIDNKNYFSLGKDLSKIKENLNIINSKLTYGFIVDKLIQVVDDHLFYNDFEFYKVKQYYQRKKNTNNNKLYDRCPNYRKDEHNRVGTKRFWEAKIEFNIDADLKSNKKFKMVTDHSKEFYNLEKMEPINNNIINEWEDFTYKIYNYLNNIKDEYDNKKVIEKIKSIYNNNKYTFNYNENKINKLIKKLA